MKQLQDWLVPLAAAVAPALIGPAHAESGVPGPEQKILRLERDQEALLRKLKQDIQGMEDSPRKGEFKARIEEIERRIRAPQDLYISPSSRLTPQMTAYYARMSGRLEDCGTRHFPAHNGQKLHGKAVVGMTLDRHGRLIKTEVLDSSGERLIDVHIPKLVAASAPFGDVPDDVVLDQQGPFRNLVVVTRFDFERDDKPLPDPLPEADRCKWG